MCDAQLVYCFIFLKQYGEMEPSANLDDGI